MKHVLTFDDLRAREIISTEQKEILEDLVMKGDNILIVGHDESLVSEILLALDNAKRSKFTSGSGVFFVNSDAEEDLKLAYPHSRTFTLNLTETMKALDLRKILREVMFVNDRLIIEIDSSATLEYYLVCCEGLLNDVLASYIYNGETIDQIINSFVQLNLPEIENLPVHLVRDRILNYINIIIICGYVDGKPKITAINYQ